MRTLKPAIAAIVLFSLAGCNSMQASHDADDQFATASNRPPTAATLYASAQLLEARGRDDEALFVYQRLNRDYPNFAPAYCATAEYHMRHNHVGEAAAALKTGLGISPDDPVLINNLGMCAMMQSDYEQALAHFTRAAGIAASNARYRANMGAALGMMGRYDEALSIYEQVLSEEDSHYNVGVLAQSRGDKTRSEAEFALADEKANAKGSKKDAGGASMDSSAKQESQPAAPKETTPMYVMPPK